MRFATLFFFVASVSQVWAIDRNWPMEGLDVRAFDTMNPHRTLVDEVERTVMTCQFRDPLLQARKQAAEALPAIEAEANKESVTVENFQDFQHPTPEMDAAALLTYYEGIAAFKLGDYAGAKLLFERVWRKYPFVRVTHVGFFFIPAEEAYRMWAVIMWMDAIRSGKLDALPMNADFYLYQDSRGCMVPAKVGPGKGGSIPYLAAREVFRRDGPKAIEKASNQMMAADVFHNIYRSSYPSALIGALAEPLEQNSEVNEAQWTEPQKWTRHQALLEKWVAADPKSDVAKMALVRFWINYAWEARGSGWASTVTQEGWKGFQERLQHAVAVQRSALINHPVWYTNGLLLGRALSAAPEKQMAFFEDAIEKFPWFRPLYTEMLTDLLPRWGGGQRDWQRFVLMVGQKIDPELYEFLLDEANDYGEAINPDDPVLDSSLLLKAYQKRAEREPTWAFANQFAQLACLKGDKAAAQTAFHNPACRFHPLYWNGQAEYDHWRKWAEVSK